MASIHPDCPVFRWTNHAMLNAPDEAMAAMTTRLRAVVNVIANPLDHYPDHDGVLDPDHRLKEPPEKTIKSDPTFEGGETDTFPIAVHHRLVLGLRIRLA